MANNSGNPCIPRDPEHLLSLPLIPPRLIKFIPKEQRPTKCTEAQIMAIKAILRMRYRQAFFRCKGRRPKAIKAFEAKGDFTHSGKTPECGGCDECRCLHPAGFATKGDFYGLGPETGHLGVGYCAFCQIGQHILPGIALRIARHEVEVLQKYGNHNMDSEYALSVAKQEAALARQSTEAREELKMILDELERFKSILSKDDGERPTMYVKGELVPVSDMDLISAKMDIAKTISKMKLDNLKMDDDHYIHVDELISRAAEIQLAFRECVETAVELVRDREVRGKKGDTSKTPEQYAEEMFAEKWRATWATVKRGRRK